MSEKSIPETNPEADIPQAETAPDPGPASAPVPASTNAQTAEPTPAKSVDFETLGKATGLAGNGANSLEMLMDVPMGVTVELGRTKMPVQDVLGLQSGSVIELDHLAGEAVDIFINSHLMAKGEVVVVDDRFGVRITQILSSGNGNGNGKGAF